MNEFDLDAELVNLLRSEERKQPSAHASIEAERYDLLLSLQDHIAMVDALPEDLTVESFFTVTKMGDDPDDDTLRENRLDLLTELVRNDVDRQESLAHGEMRVSGEGYYYFFSEERGCDDGESLTNGETLSGYVSDYAVLPMYTPAYIERTQQDDFDPDRDRETMSDVTDGIWVVLNDVVVYDSSGFEQSKHEVVTVPFSFPGLIFHKVERQSTTKLAPEVRRSSIKTHLMSTEFSEQCIQVENDLNFNPAEAHDQDQRLIEHQEYINKLTAHLNRTAVVSLTYFETVDASGRLEHIHGKAARYVQSLVCEERGGWRVMHCFEVADDTKALIMITQEHIDSIIELSD